MNPIASIRKRLDMTQTELATAIAVSQGTVSNYERGQDVPIAVARRLIWLCRSNGLEVSFDDVFLLGEAGVVNGGEESGQGKPELEREAS